MLNLEKPNCQAKILLAYLSTPHQRAMDRIIQADKQEADKGDAMV
jgi:hypothetical protein